MTDSVETTIRRGRNNNPWVQAPKAVIENASISVEARWLLVYLLGKPDGWIIRVADIQNRTGWGRDKTRKHIKELVEAHYLLPEYNRDGGRFAAMRFVVLDEPGQPETTWDDRDGLPVTGKPSTAEPYTANQPLNKNDIYQELKDTKKEEKAASPLLPSKGFEEFWAAYPKKVAKPRAERAFAKAIKRTDIKTILTALARYTAATDPAFYANPATWLNDDRWNDQLPTLKPAFQRSSEAALDANTEFWRRKLAEKERT
jgi:hypothetical protein